jgi:hypothetical protein
MWIMKRNSLVNAPTAWNAWDYVKEISFIRKWRGSTTTLSDNKNTMGIVQRHTIKNNI